MNNLHDQERAWKFVNGFDVPRLDNDKRGEWRVLIGQISVDEFQKACRAARERPTGQLHMRPSIEAFKGYAGVGGTSNTSSALPTWKPIPRVEKSDNLDSYANRIVAQGKDALAAGKARRAEEPRWTR